MGTKSFNKSQNKHTATKGIKYISIINANIQHTQSINKCKTKIINE